MPATYAGGFSIAMCARQIIFLPAAAAGASATLRRGVGFAPRAVGATALVAVTTGVRLFLGHTPATPRPHLGRTSATPRPHLGHTSATLRPHLGHPYGSTQA